MTLFTVPGWLQNAGAVNTAEQMRNYVSAALPGDGQLRSIGGVNYMRGDGFTVVENSPTNMNVRVRSGIAAVPGSEVGNQGCYFAANDATVTLAVTAAHASLARIDAVVVRIRDSQYSGALNTVALEVVAGTPSATPAVPTLPANSLLLAVVAVGASVTAIVQANITDMRYPINDTLFVRKASTETINNSTTLQNDDELFLDINIPNSFWQLEVFMASTANTAADLKFSWSAPASTIMTWHGINAATAFLNPTDVGTFASSGGNDGLYIVGTVNIGSTLGRLQFRWAQNALHASNAQVLFHSWIRLTRLR